MTPEERRKQVIDSCEPLKRTLAQLPEGAVIVRDDLRLHNDAGAVITLRAMAAALRQIAETCDTLARNAEILRDSK